MKKFLLPVCAVWFILSMTGCGGNDSSTKPEPPAKPAAAPQASPQSTSPAAEPPKTDTQATGNVHEEARGILKKLIPVLQASTNQFKNAKSGKDAAAAIREYTVKCSPLASRMEELQEKKPELKDPIKTKDILGADLSQQIEKTMKEFIAAASELDKKYKDDPDYQAAVADMKQVAGIK